LGGRLEIIERGDSNLSDMAKDASRVTIGHSEGMPLAFANIYLDIAREIEAINSNHKTSQKPLYPDVEDGLRSVAAVYAAKSSSNDLGAWTPAVPLILK